MENFEILCYVAIALTIIAVVFAFIYFAGYLRKEKFYSAGIPVKMNDGTVQFAYGGFI
jgi:hypothetical protein